MKKILLSILILLLISLGVFYWLFTPKAILSAETIYLNANDDVSYNHLEKLAKALKKEGKQVILSKNGEFHSGLFNIYAATDIQNLPAVLDKKSINFLWIPVVENGDTELLRPFDVIIVHSISSFNYLKAINVRTAYIPLAINTVSSSKPAKQSYPMYYGDNNNGFSLSLYLAGPSDIKVDVFGQGFSGYWDEDEIMIDPATPGDFQRYPLVLADQTDEDIRDELINENIIKIIEHGGLPYLRYNSGIEKIFGKIIPMYTSAEEFLPRIKYLLNDIPDLNQRRKDMLEIAKKWNSESQAKKFIELFEVMKKKMK